VSRRFERYFGIDYSGARTPADGLKGLQVYIADAASEPHEVAPAQSRYWTRREVAGWLVDRLAEGRPAIAGIDHSFSFPLRYFEKYRLPLDWTQFLIDFRSFWPTDQPATRVDLVRQGACGNGAARIGDSRWRRICEVRARAKSSFHFDVPGSVAKSTHAGLPWLLFIRERLGNRVHFWPYDGWDIPADRSVVLEAYPSLWSKEFPPEGRNEHQHDAYTIAAWLHRTDFAGMLEAYFRPSIGDHQRRAVAIEGWILGLK
jgi:hypothetical protein